MSAKMRGYMYGVTALSCARMVVKAVRDRGLNPRAAVIAVTTRSSSRASTTSAEELDHDSLGLFQQRASWGTGRSGWTRPGRPTPFSARCCRRVLYPNNGWLTAPIGEVCQAVQVFGVPGPLPAAGR